MKNKLKFFFSFIFKKHFVFADLNRYYWYAKSLLRF